MHESGGEASSPHRGRAMSLASGLGWLAIVAALLVWEGIGLTRNRDGWYTVSDLIRVVTSARVGRWVLFALWLWLGWHVFIRGWRFFLDALPATGTAPIGPSPTETTSRLFRTDVGPMVAAFALAAGGVAAWYRTRLRGPRWDGIVTQPTLPSVAVTVVVGYAMFLALDGLYYALVAGQRRSFLIQAATGGAFLAFVAAPAGFAAIGALVWALRRLAGRRSIRN